MKSSFCKLDTLQYAIKTGIHINYIFGRQQHMFLFIVYLKLGIYIKISKILAWQKCIHTIINFMKKIETARAENHIGLF